MDQEEKKMRNIHNFSTKLQQQSVIDQLRQYIEWQRKSISIDHDKEVDPNSRTV